MAPALTHYQGVPPTPGAICSCNVWLQKLSIPPPRRGFFLRPPYLAGNSSQASYIYLNFYAFENPPPPRNVQKFSLLWGEYGYLLKLHTESIHAIGICSGQNIIMDYRLLWYFWKQAIAHAVLGNIVNVRPNVRFTLSSAQTAILFQNIMLFFAVAYQFNIRERKKQEPIDQHAQQTILKPKLFLALVFSSD